MRNIYQWSNTLCALVLGMLVFMHTAQAQDTGGLDDLSLEDLLSVEVVTASKNAESLSDAPGVVSTITAKEIEQFGATNLLEVLERLPGTFGLSYSVFPYGIMTIRGVTMAEVSNRVLVLLDGRPMRESTHGAMTMSIYTAFPLETIQRIEVIRGPGSVLYGSNAFAGVINIITKKAEATSLATTVGYGSFKAKSITTQGSFQHGNLSIVGGIRYTQEENAQEPGEAFNMGENLVGASLTARYKRLALTSFAGVNTLANYDATSDYEELEAQHVTADLAYEQPVTAWWEASANATFNYTRNLFGLIDEVATDYVVEATNHLRPFTNANLIVGGLAYGLTGQGSRDGNFHLPEYAEVRWSGYAQLDVRPIEKLKLIAGGQVNKVDGVALDFVPRLGAIVNATEALGAKLLYGQAFRSAFAVERSIAIPGRIMGNPNLSPEKVTTLDAQLFYNAPRLQLAATYFYSHQRDLIALMPTEAGRFFINQDKTAMQGLELESKYKPNDRLYLTGSFVYQVPDDGDGHRIESIVPNTMAKAGASYAVPAGVTVGLFDTFFSTPDFEFTTANAPKSVHYMTAKVSLDVTTLLHLHHVPAMQFSVYANNLLGQEVYTPDPGHGGGDAHPHSTGRSFSGALRVTL